MKRTITTLQDKINFIVENTMFTPDDVLKLPLETFEKVYEHVSAMVAAIHRVECDVILYGGK